MINVAFDMETQDPDDVLTLCLLATHPEVSLRAVTVHPGSLSQIGVVRHILDRLEVSIPVGSNRPKHLKKCVSEFHYRWLGDTPERNPDDWAEIILRETHRKYSDLQIVTGGPLTNVSNFIGEDRPEISEITIQGGFAGDSVVPKEHRLPKFDGRETCPTFNLNGNVDAAKLVLSYPNFGSRQLVSKNVCHGVAWNREMHERMRSQKDAHAGLSMVFQAMDLYLERKPEGKLLHDPLAACAAVDPLAFEWREVEVYREKGEWGSRLKEGTGTRISVAVDQDWFESFLVGDSGGFRCETDGCRSKALYDDRGFRLSGQPFFSAHCRKHRQDL